MIAVCSLLTACRGTPVEVETSVEETTEIISETGEMETIDVTDGVVTDTPEVEIIPSSDSDVVGNQPSQVRKAAHTVIVLPVPSYKIVKQK